MEWLVAAQKKEIDDAAKTTQRRAEQPEQAKAQGWQIDGKYKPCVKKQMVSLQCGVKHVACCSCHGRPGSPPTDTRLRLQRRGAMPA